SIIHALSFKSDRKAASRHETNMQQQQITPARRITILIGLVLALVSTSFGFAKIGKFVPGIPPQLGVELVFWTIAALVVLYVLVAERLQLSAMGLKRLTWRSGGYAIGAWVVTFLLLEVMVQFLFPLLHLGFNTKIMQQILNLPYWLRF